MAGGEALLPAPAGPMIVVQDPEEAGAECHPAGHHMVEVVDKMDPVRTVADAPMAAQAIIHPVEEVHAAAMVILVRFNLSRPPPKM
ncbi:hypothetical protein AA0472_1295 [Acetobacter estunensis NRIC 0472]|nr:hypothetical protein AA0472_1295 [Acetobacter estunensis NRIC 0472]